MAGRQTPDNDRGDPRIAVAQGFAPGDAENRSVRVPADQSAPKRCHVRKPRRDREGGPAQHEGPGQARGHQAGRGHNHSPHRSAPLSCEKGALIPHNRTDDGGKPSGTQIQVNKRIIAALTADDILAIVEAEHDKFNAVNVSTACNQLAKTRPKSSRAFGQADALCKDDRRVPILLSTISRVLTDMTEANLSCTLCGLSKLGWQLEERSLCSQLQQAIVHLAPNLHAQGVANILWGLAKLWWQAGVEVTRSALERAAMRAASTMNAQNVANTLWALATLGWHDGERAMRSALEGAAMRLAPSMSAWHVSGTLWALATLGWQPGERAMLVNVAVRVASTMSANELSNALWALAALGWGAGKEAMLGQVMHVASAMNAQGVANTLWAVATLGSTSRLGSGGTHALGARRGGGADFLWHEREKYREHTVGTRDAWVSVWGEGNARSRGESVAGGVEHEIAGCRERAVGACCARLAGEGRGATSR